MGSSRVQQVCTFISQPFSENTNSTFDTSWPADFPPLANPPPTSRTANTSSSYSIESRQRLQQQIPVSAAPVSWATATKPSKDRVFRGTILPSGTLVPTPLPASRPSSLSQQLSSIRRSNDDIFAPLIKTISTFNDPKPNQNLVRNKLERLFPRVYDELLNNNNNDGNGNRGNTNGYHYHHYYDWEIYIEEAEKEGIVRIGSNSDKDWIGLRPHIERERLGGNGRR